MDPLSRAARIDLARLPPRPAGARAIHMIVETTAGSRSKFRYDEALGLFRLHKHLPRGCVFPFDLGFVPGTIADDGDPLDVLLVETEPTFVGCLVTARLLGVIDAEQTERGETIRNDRLIATPETPKIRPRRTIGRRGPRAPSKLIDRSAAPSALTPSPQT